MLKERNADGSEGGSSSQSAREADVRQTLVAHGVADEHINEVVAQLNVLVDAPPPSDAAVENGSASRQRLDERQRRIVGWRNAV